MADVNDSIVAGAKFGEKLIDTVGKGLSGISSPRQIKRIGKASYEAMSLIGKGIRENADIIKDPQLSGVYERFVERSIYNGLLNEQNVENIIRLAQSSIPGDTPCSAEPVDDCWFTRFMNYAGEISNEEMQKIWAQILAGEIQQPGAFSLRTLDVVRNISRNEALLFQKILPFIMIGVKHRYFMCSDDKIFKKYDVLFDDILRLKDCALMTSADALTLHFNVGVASSSPVYAQNIMLSVGNKSNKQKSYALGVYVLTEAGIELYNMIKPKANIDYVCDMAERLYNSCKTQGIELKLYRVKDVVGNIIKHEGLPLKTWLN